MTGTVTSDGLCVAEVLKDSPEKMTGIRSIMVEQESLFKEQVQALHRLYKVQKLEMKGLENKKNHLRLETAELTDGFSSISQSEDKSRALVRPIARVYKPETGSLSLHPFCSLKLFEGSGSVSFGGFFQRPEGSLSKQFKDFDLERLPEGWVDESSLVIESDGSYPTSKESEIACVEDYKSGMSIDTSEDGLLTSSSDKVVSGETKGIQDSSTGIPMDRKVKLSHQGSFASVNGCLNSSSSEGEENNSKMAATFKMTEGNQGIMAAKIEFPKVLLSHNGQIPPPRPQSADMQTWTLKTVSERVERHSSDIPASEGIQSSELTSGAAYLVSYRKIVAGTPLTKGEENEYTQANRAAEALAGPAPNNSISVQQLPVPGKAETEVEASDFLASSNESSNPSKRKHWKGTIAIESGYNELMKFSKSAKMFPSRSTP